MNKRQLMLCGLAASASVMLPAMAQDWPTRPIKIIVGYPPGGPVDSLVRLMLPRLGQELGQPVIVENRAGAAGAIGVTSTLQADPDGYTFGIGVLGVLAILPHLQKVSFSTAEVNYLTLLTKSPHVLVVAKDSPYHSLKDFVEAARRAPGKLNYGSPGTGSSTHLDGEMLEQEARIDAQHIPYKGGAAVMNALLGNEIQMVAAEISAVLTLLSKVRVIAVLGEQRSQQLPDVPTAIEQGYPRLVSSSVYGAIAPPKVPAVIAERFRKALIAALDSREVSDKLLAQGQTPTASTPETYRAFMVAESGKWEALIKERQLRLE